MKAVMESVLDAALRLQELATEDQVPLSMGRMQRLLFLAQISFAERYQGRKLMPAHFAVYQGIPIEPNVKRAFSQGQPMLGKAVLPGHVELFFIELWEQQENMTLKGIDASLKRNAVFQKIIAQGEGAEITFDALRAIAGLEWKNQETVRGTLSRPQATMLEKMNKPQVEQLQDGRVVKSWQPRVSSRQKHFLIETVKRKK